VRSFFLVAFAAIFLVSPAQLVIAQSPEMPVPNLVVKDADGKVMGQVAGFMTISTDFFPIVALNVDGKIAYLVYRSYGLIDRVASSGGSSGSASVYFSNSDCIGDVYVNQISEVGLEGQSGNMYGVGGPDSITGEYKLYRSTTLTVSVPSVSSKWEGGACKNYGPITVGVLAAEEVSPNPFEGFHGPTLANPERVLTIEGGTRLP